MLNLAVEGPSPPPGVPVSRQLRSARIMTLPTSTLFDLSAGTNASAASPSMEDDLRAFSWQGRATVVSETIVDGGRGAHPVSTFVNEFWTSRQRAAHSLHEISYRACFKPQLPRFFIERLTRPGDTVYDPFMGRGTTILEAALLGRTPVGCDVNPLSAMLVAPRLSPPSIGEVSARLARISWDAEREIPEELLTFYHPRTLREICSLKTHLAAAGALDRVDAWIRMVAVNRLTGHSPGFFSVYTLPPNQAASVAAQRKINADRTQVPPYRSVPDLILRKSRSLLADCAGGTTRDLDPVAARARLITGRAAATINV